MPVAAGHSSRAAWIAAGAVGAILGIVAVLWDYQPPPAKARVVAAEAPRPPLAPPAPPAVPPPAAPAEAERALRQATTSVREAQVAYEQSLRQYEQGLRDFAGNRITREELARYLERLQEQARILRQRQQALAEKTLLSEEPRPVPVRNSP
jgi:hypothetical protein